MRDVFDSKSGRRRRLSRLSLGTWLMATVLLAVGLAVLTCALLIEGFARAHAERRAAESLNQMAVDFRDALDRGMATQYQEIRVLAALDQFRQFDKPAEVRRALVGDVHGAVLLEKLLPRQAEPWRFVDFSVPIRNVQGDLLGVFVSHLSWAWARQVKRELIDAALIEHDADALVIARDGTVLLGPPGLEGKPLVGISPGLLSFAGATDSASLTRVDGVPYFIASTVTRGKDSYPGQGWTVLLRQPASVALADYFQLRQQIVITALLPFALFVPLAWWVSRRLSAPLVTLTAAIAARHHLGEALMPRMTDYREAELLSNALADLSDRQAQQDALLERRVDERTAALQQAMVQLAGSEQRLEQLSRTDSLTACPNRRQFEERLPEAMARTQRSRLLMAVLYIDVDKFKRINDDLGHAAGDTVLTEVARRLVACVRGTDTVARLGCDEFVVILEGLQAASEPARLAAKIVVDMARPFDVQDMKWMVTVSVGVAAYQGDDVSGEMLLAQADAALCAAKSAGRNTFRLAS